MRQLIPIAFAALLAATPASAQTKDEIAALRTSVEANLTGNILPFWTANTPDPNGGFYGTVVDKDQPVADADKGSILHARILWTYARAYREYPIEEYRKMADSAAEYYIQHFIDPKHGGVYWSVDAEGHPKDMTKQTYAASYGIYGLAEHFRATGDVRSLEAAKAIYRTLEEKVHDKQRSGYYEVFGRDYAPGSLKGVDGKVGAIKTMNSHIHLLEAYTCLYQAWPNAELKGNLEELFGILQNRLYSPETKHLILFCDNEWNSIGHVDSYGHDIETSWLLTEAAEAIGDPEKIAAARRQAIEMVDVALREGLNSDGAMIYEKDGGVTHRHLSWWPQCETVIGCINAWQITGNRKYFDVAARTWDYIDKHFVDHVNGGWHKLLNEDGTLRPVPKASTWNCPYHNSRVAYELNQRLAWPSVHSEVMAWSNITGVRVEGELVDFESSLRIGTPGEMLETTARERQNGITYKREGDTQITVTPMHSGATITQRVTDVDTETVQLSWEVTPPAPRAGGEVTTANEPLSTDEVTVPPARGARGVSAYFGLDFAPEHYADAKISAKGKRLSVVAPDRKVELTFSRSVKMQVRDENGHKVVYVTLMPELAKGAKAELAATMKVAINNSNLLPPLGGNEGGLNITVHPDQPGRIFTGFGGNFRIQNVKNDPKVIDYCLDNLRVAFGRVEFPWARWDKEGAEADHIRRSAEMARRLKAQGMPVIVSCWFPPEWAGTKTTRSDGSATAWALKPEQKERIFESMASYLLFLKKDYGVEADYFSFNESDLGIDVVFTPEEHRDFIKEFGQYLAERGLKTLMLLGDNSDATTFDFILPTLADASAHKYVGAISFHSWRGCDDATLAKWADASRQINVPLIVGEGSTDAAAWRYPGIFNETTFALYEINLYTRLCALCQPVSILQWQLTSDYSLLWGDGIYGSDGPLRPTQRFFNIKQLSMTPADAFAMPAEATLGSAEGAPSLTGKAGGEDITVAAFTKPATGESAVHIVNNGGATKAHITGLPASATTALVYVTNARQHAEASMFEVHNGSLDVLMPADSFVSIITSSK